METYSTEYGRVDVSGEIISLCKEILNEKKVDPKLTEWNICQCMEESAHHVFAYLQKNNFMSYESMTLMAHIELFGRTPVIRDKEGIFIKVQDWINNYDGKEKSIVIYPQFDNPALSDFNLKTKKSYLHYPIRVRTEADKKQKSLETIWKVYEPIFDWDIAEFKKKLAAYPEVTR